MGVDDGWGAARRPTRWRVGLRGDACGPTGVVGAARSVLWAGLLGVPVGGGPPASRPRCELRSARRLVVRPGLGLLHVAQFWLSIINFACNSPAACSNIEFASLELQRFPAVSKNYRLKLCAKFVWVRPAIARRRRGQALSPPTGTSAWSDSRGLFDTFHARSSGSFAAEASPRRAPNGAIPPRLVVVKLDLRLVWCPKCSPPRRITVKMGCCGRSGLRFGHNCVGHGVCPPRACALT